MAQQSPLAAALKPALPVDDESEARYQSALQQMTQALDQRKSRSFDPVTAGYISGLQDPAVRGMGFFAEIASGMRGAVAAEKEAEKENQDIAALRLQMAQAEREMARKKKGAEMLQPPAAVVVSGAAPAEGAPAAAGAAAAPGRAAPASATPITQGDKSGRGVRLPNGLEITPDFILRMRDYDPERAEALDKFYKLTMESIAVQQGGAYNRATGEYTPFGGKPPVERFIPGDPATNTPAMRLMLPEEDAMTLDRARRTNDTKTFYEIVDRYTKAPTRPSAAVAPGTSGAAAPAAAPGVKPSIGAAARTPSEATAALEVETEAAKAEAKLAAEGRAKRFEGILSSAEDAGSRLATLKSLDAIVTKPGSEKIFGIFNRPDFLSAVGKLLETGVGVPGFSVGVPEIQNVMRNIGLPQEQINDYQLAASLFAQMQLQISRLQQGQGAVSDFERRLFGSAAITGEDNPATIRKKVALLTARANFERDVAKSLRASKMNADDFKDSDQYQNLMNSYHDRLVSIISPSGSRPGQPAAGGSAVPGAASSGAPETAESLKARLRAKGQ